MKRPIQVFDYRISNVTDDSVDIHIDGQIVDASTQEIYKAWLGDTTSVSYRSFRNELDKHNVKHYNIYINSPGGLVTDALAIHDFLKDLKNKKKTFKTYGRGLIASAATFILLASDDAEMSENSFFMIHEVSGVAWGTVDEVERQARVMRQFNDSVRDLYARKTGMRKEDIGKMMKNETWFTATEAKEKGFISTISNQTTFTNKIEANIWDMYDYTDQNVLVAYNNSVKPPVTTPENSITQEIKDMKDMLKNLGEAVKKAIQGVKPVTDAATNTLDSQALINSIADAVGKAFEGFNEQFNTAFEALKPAPAAAFDPKPITDRLDALEDLKIADQFHELDQAIQDLETAAPTRLGAGSRANENRGSAKPIGGFEQYS